MPTLRHFAVTLVAASILIPAIAAQESAPVRQLSLKPGESVVVDSPVDIMRAVVANPAVAELVAVTTREILVNAVGSGKTSLILWPKEGARVLYEVNVASPASPLETVEAELSRDLPGQDISIGIQNGTVFLRGTVKDEVSADRAAMIAGSVGKVVNLLYVAVPAAEPQILLKVRFADVDRAASLQLGANLVSTGGANTIGSTSTGQFAAPTLQTQTSPATFTLSQALNVFLFRPDLNLGAAIAALQNKNLLEILAEPNVLTINNKAASFVAGGQFPFPTVQGGANAGAVTISFREYGIKLNFLPVVTPRGTIRLHVTPEVSSLDFANGLVFQGFTIPAISTRRVDTEVELESGQSFAIAGLLDNQTTRNLSKIPGISSIPILGKLFQSISTSKSNSELLIIVTPELINPIPAGQPLPQLAMPEEFIKGTMKTSPGVPGSGDNGPVPSVPRFETVPIEQLRPQPADVPTGNPAPVTPPAGPPAKGEGL